MSTKTAFGSARSACAWNWEHCAASSRSVSPRLLPRLFAEWRPAPSC